MAKSFRLLCSRWPVHLTLWQRLTFHDKNTFLLGSIYNLLRLLGINSERLFAKHMLPRRDSIKAVLLVQTMRRADVNSIDIGVVVYALVVCVNLGFRLLRSFLPKLFEMKVVCKRRQTLHNRVQCLVCSREERESGRPQQAQLEHAFGSKCILGSKRGVNSAQRVIIGYCILQDFSVQRSLQSTHIC